MMAMIVMMMPMAVSLLLGGHGPSLRRRSAVHNPSRYSFRRLRLLVGGVGVELRERGGEGCRGACYVDRTEVTRARGCSKACPGQMLVMESTMMMRPKDTWLPHFVPAALASCWQGGLLGPCRIRRHHAGSSAERLKHPSRCASLRLVSLAVVALVMVVMMIVMERSLAYRHSRLANTKGGCG